MAVSIFSARPAVDHEGQGLRHHKRRAPAYGYALDGRPDQSP
jgi:hypothetical protein